MAEKTPDIPDTVVVEYCGVSSVSHMAPGFVGIVNPGDKITIFKTDYASEYKTRTDWKLVKTTKSKGETNDS